MSQDRNEFANYEIASIRPVAEMPTLQANLGVVGHDRESHRVVIGLFCQVADDDLLCYSLSREHALELHSSLAAVLRDTGSN